MTASSAAAKVAPMKSKSSTQDSWGTPRHIIDRVRELADGRIALDPCSNPDSIVGAEIEWYGPEAGGRDGLLLPWSDPEDTERRLVYVNPPYSAKYEWMWKCHHEHMQNVMLEIVALLPADTDTQWFHKFGAKATKRCFLNKRLKFRGDREHGARFPCAVFYWGVNLHRFIKSFDGAGWIV